MSKAQAGYAVVGAWENFHYFNGVFPGQYAPEVINQPWVPEVLPLMLAKLGNVQIAALPVEPTAMAGRRLRNRLSELSGIFPGNIVIAGYSNDYVSYLTTTEEFSQQHYEGASTLFGPWELNAMMQAFSSLYRQLSKQQPPPVDEAVPLDLSYLYDNVHVEDVLEKEDARYGRIVAASQGSIDSGQSVKLQYIASHPGSGMNLDSFFYVQKKNDCTESWDTVATDDDWTTRFKWQSGVATVEWTPDRYDKEGLYRIVIRGDYYTADAEGDRVKKHYESTSRVFYYSAHYPDPDTHLYSGYLPNSVQSPEKSCSCKN